MRDFSEQTAFMIDQEIQRFLNEAADRATTLLRDRREELDLLADALLEQESIGKEEIIRILGERVRVDGQPIASNSSTSDSSEA